MGGKPSGGKDGKHGTGDGGRELSRLQHRITHERSVLRGKRRRHATPPEREPENR